MVFSKEIENNAFFGGGGGEGKGANKVCIMENVQMVNYSLEKDVYITWGQPSELRIV